MDAPGGFEGPLRKCALPGRKEEKEEEQRRQKRVRHKGSWGVCVCGVLASNGGRIPSVLSLLSGTGQGAVGVERGQIKVTVGRGSGTSSGQMGRERAVGREELAFS